MTRLADDNEEVEFVLLVITMSLGMRMMVVMVVVMMMVVMMVVMVVMMVVMVVVMVQSFIVPIYTRSSREQPVHPDTHWVQI